MDNTSVPHTAILAYPATTACLKEAEHVLMQDRLVAFCSLFVSNLGPNML